VSSCSGVTVNVSRPGRRSVGRVVRPHHHRASSVRLDVDGVLEVPRRRQAARAVLVVQDEPARGHLRRPAQEPRHQDDRPLRRRRGRVARRVVRWSGGMDSQIRVAGTFQFGPAPARAERGEPIEGGDLRQLVAGGVGPPVDLLAPDPVHALGAQQPCMGVGDKPQPVALCRPASRLAREEAERTNRHDGQDRQDHEGRGKPRSRPVRLRHPATSPRTRRPAARMVTDNHGEDSR